MAQGRTKPSPPPTLLPGRPQDQRRRRGPASPPMKICGVLPAAAGHAPGGGESRCASHRPRGEGGTVLHLYPRPRGLQTSGAAPLPGTIPKAGAGTSAGPSSTGPGSSKQPGKDPGPTRTVECWDRTVPQGCGLREGSPAAGAGLPAPGQSRCPGERGPSEGRAVLSPSCRAQAGRAGGKGGPSRGWRAPRWLTSPFRAGGGTGTRLPASPPPRSSTLQRAGCTSRASAPWGRTRAAAGNTAAARSSVAAGTSAAQPAWLTWSPLPRGRGRQGWGRLAGWTPASPAPRPVAGALTCTRGRRGPGAQASRPHNHGRMPAGYQALSPSHSPLARAGRGVRSGDSEPAGHRGHRRLPQSRLEPGLEEMRWAGPCGHDLLTWAGLG